MFFPNLNVFLACLILLSMFAAGPLLMLLSVALAPFGGAGKGFSTYMFPIAYGLLALPLLIFWWKTGLAPAVRRSEREGRYRIGHRLVAITTIATVAAFALPIVLARLAGNANLSMLAWFAMPVYALGFLVWAGGLFMIWSSSGHATASQPTR